MRRFRTWFALGLLAGCEEVEIPTGTLVVKVDRDAAAVPAPGANVVIPTTTGSATTDAAGTATFASIIVGTFNVMVTLADYCASTQSVTVTDGATTTLNVSLGTSPCPSDQITTDGSEPLFVLADVRTGLAPVPASCENDRQSEGTSGIADLLTNVLRLSDGAFSCHGATWLFTAGHAPWFDNTAGTFPWTNSGGDVLTVTLPANRLRIPVTFWLTDFPGKPDYKSALVESLLPDANHFLYKQYTGLVLTNSDTTDDLPDIVDAGTHANPAAAATHPEIGTGCSNTWLIVKSAFYKPQHLNVYVVEEIEDKPSGINCVRAGSANVIFVDHYRGYQNLLHEIGHGLALFRPHWGHSDGLKDLYPFNLMDSAIDEKQDHYLSLGQIAWMHADANSWLNEVNGVGTVRSRQFPSPFVTSCSCSDAPTQDCPALHADMSRPGAGTPNAGVADRACHLTTSDSCLALSKGATGVIAAEGWIDSMKSGPGYGLYTYSSLAPSVAEVSFDSATGSFLQVKVTAVSTGSTYILLSLGGAFARVQVNVGSTCP